MRVLALLLFFLCVAVPVRAAGFEGPGVSPTVTRAADVLDAQDDAPCVLEGHILEKIPFRKNRYLFGDGSGRVVVEIENDIFGHLTITPHDRSASYGPCELGRKRSMKWKWTPWPSSTKLTVRSGLTLKSYLALTSPQVRHARLPSAH